MHECFVDSRLPFIMIITHELSFDAKSPVNWLSEKSMRARWGLFLKSGIPPLKLLPRKVSCGNTNKGLNSPPRDWNYAWSITKNALNWWCWTWPSSRWYRRSFGCCRCQMMTEQADQRTTAQCSSIWRNIIGEVWDMWQGGCVGMVHMYLELTWGNSPTNLL